MFNRFTYSRSIGAALMAGAATLWVSAASAQTMQSAPQNAPMQMQQMEEPYPQAAYPQTQNQPPQNQPPQNQPPQNQSQTMQPQGQAMPWNESMPQSQQAPVYGQEGYHSQGYQEQGAEGYQGQQQPYSGQGYQQQGYQQQEYLGQESQQQGAGVVPHTMPNMPQHPQQQMYQERTHTRIERYVPPAGAAQESMERGEALTPLPGERQMDQQMAVNNPANIRFMSGGIGQEEREQFKSAEADFPVKLSFANRNGAFLSNVDVTITDKAGQTVLGLKTQGPILLVDLKPGNYTVKAKDNGEVISRDIAVSSSPRSYTVHFKTGAQDYSS